MTPDTGSRTEADAAAFDRAHTPYEDTWPEWSDVIPDCDDCGDTGWVNYGCTRDPDCPGGDCCDRPCRSCERGGHDTDLRS